MWTTLEVGQALRLERDLELREEKSGTLRAYLRKGAVVKVRRIEPDLDQLFLEGLNVPVPLTALRRMVRPVA